MRVHVRVRVRVVIGLSRWSHFFFRETPVVVAILVEVGARKVRDSCANAVVYYERSQCSGKG